MTGALLELLRLASSLPTFGVDWEAVGWTVGLILVVVLFSKELVRAFAGEQDNASMRGFNFALVPLLAVLGFAVLERVVHL